MSQDSLRLSVSLFNILLCMHTFNMCTKYHCMNHDKIGACLQRERKERKLYSDDWALGDEEIEGHHTFDLEQKIKSNEFDSCFVKDMTNVGKFLFLSQQLQL